MERWKGQRKRSNMTGAAQEILECCICKHTESTGTGHTKSRAVEHCTRYGSNGRIPTFFIHKIHYFSGNLLKAFN